MVAMSLYPKSVRKFIRTEKSRIRKLTSDVEKQKLLIMDVYKQMESYKKTPPKE
ncbi:MAG TPA: hypothetical protein VJC11_01870 [Patescibacteria group bacterium]|nr:hypothetical protein [Patescibacteria group bacterium]